MRARPVAAALLALCAACNSGSPKPTPAPSLGPRIASTASVKIVEPAAGASLPAGSVHVKIELTGGTITPDVSTDLKPDVGHVHLKMDGHLVSMNYETESDITVAAGQHLLEVEYVALDHGPFNPRVLTTSSFTAT